MARITSLEEEISQSTEELEELQEKTGAIEEEIKALEKKILDIGGARLLAQKSKVDGIRLHINLANDEITKAEVAKSRAEKDIVKFKKSIASSNESSQEVESELEELNEQLEECTAFVNEIRSKVEQAQNVAEQSKDDMDNLKAELDEKTEGIQAFRQKEVRSSVIYWNVAHFFCYPFFCYRWNFSKLSMISTRRRQRTSALLIIGSRSTTT